jgi:hypothetical protein
VFSPLLPDECRVLGVLIEKAQTTPGQYPLTLNSVVTACSQKSNRDPVRDYDEDAAMAALDGLRAKGLVRELSMEGSRVPKYRHIAREALGIDTPQLIILAELLLRGPQTTGELRTNASRMHPIESGEVVQAVLQSLAARPEPLAKELAPPPGSRAPRWTQLLCPGLHPLERAAADPAGHGSAGRAMSGSSTAPTPQTALPTAELFQRLESMERQMESMRKALRKLGIEVV